VANKLSLTVKFQLLLLLIYTVYNPGLVCISPLVDRGRITKQISLFFGACKQSQIRMFSVHAEMSPLITFTTASVLSATCSMLAVRQQRKLRHQFVDVSDAKCLPCAEKLKDTNERNHEQKK